MCVVCDREIGEIHSIGVIRQRDGNSSSRREASFRSSRSRPPFEARPRALPGRVACPRRPSDSSAVRPSSRSARVPPPSGRSWPVSCGRSSSSSVALRSRPRSDSTPCATVPGPKRPGGPAGVPASRAPNAPRRDDVLRESERRVTASVPASIGLEGVSLNGRAPSRLAGLGSPDFCPFCGNSPRWPGIRRARPEGANAACRQRFEQWRTAIVDDVEGERGG